MYHKEPDHDNGSPPRSLTLFESANVLSQNNSNDEMAHAHSHGTDRQHGLPAHSIDPEDGRDSGNKHDNTHDTRREQARGCFA